MSALLVCSMGMSVGRVVVTIWGSTPLSLAGSRARSTSEPVGCILPSVMPKGGIARSMAIRILPAFFMSSSVSACADSPSDRRAKAAPAIRRSSEAIFIARLLVQDHIRQIAAELLLVYGVQGAVLEPGRNPLVHFFQQPRFVLLDADGAPALVEHALHFNLTSRVVLIELPDQHFGGGADVDLTAQERLP